MNWGPISWGFIFIVLETEFSLSNNVSGLQRTQWGASAVGWAGEGVLYRILADDMDIIPS